MVGCKMTLPVKPPKPTLKIDKQSNGGICLDKINTQKLGGYILQLEQGYK